MDTLIGQVADVASAVPERLGYCHAPTQARGRYAHWSQLHRVTLREVSRCRHAALDHMLHRPSDTYAGDPEHCRAANTSPTTPASRRLGNPPVSEERLGADLGAWPKRLQLPPLRLSSPPCFRGARDGSARVWFLRAQVGPQVGGLWAVGEKSRAGVRMRDSFIERPPPDFSRTIDQRAQLHSG